VLILHEIKQLPCKCTAQLTMVTAAHMALTTNTLHPTTHSTSTTASLNDKTNSTATQMDEHSRKRRSVNDPAPDNGRASANNSSPNPSTDTAQAGTRLMRLTVKLHCKITPCFCGRIFEKSSCETVQLNRPARLWEDSSED